MFWFFGREGCGILAPKPGIEPSLPTLEGKVSTTGPNEKSLQPLDHQGSPSSLLKRSMMRSYIIWFTLWEQFQVLFVFLYLYSSTIQQSGRQ